MLVGVMEYAALVRRLLRCANRPHELERDAFGLALARAAGCGSVRLALERAIDEAFAERPEAWSTHRTLLRRYDLEAHVARPRAAGELGLSTRRFYYVQAEAVQRVAERVAQIMETHSAATPFARVAALLNESDPLRGAAQLRAAGSSDGDLALQALYLRAAAAPHGSEDLACGDIPSTHASAAHAFRALFFETRGRRDEAVRELEAAAALKCDHFGRPRLLPVLAIAMVRGRMARHDGDAAKLTLAAREAHAAGGSLPRGFDSWAELLAIESAVARGDPAGAQARIDAALPHALESGRFRDSALLGLYHAQVAFLRGDFATAARGARLLCACAAAHGDIADAAALLAVRAAAATGRPGTLRRQMHGSWAELYARALNARRAGLAQEALAIAGEAERLGYRNVFAHALATTAAVNGDADGITQAWQIWRAGGHYLDGIDVIPPSDAGTLLHPSVVEAIARLAAAVSAPGFFWAAILHAALENAPPRALDGMLGNGGFSALPRGVESIVSPKPFARAVGVLLPFAQRASFEAALCRLLTYCNARARRSMERDRARSVLQTGA